MKITNGRIEAAWNVAQGLLARYRYPGGESLRLFRFRREAEPICSYLREEREKLIAQYGPEKMQNGLLKFGSKEDCEAFCAERDALENAESEIGSLPLRLRMPERIELGQGDLEAMDGLIELYDPEEIRVTDLRVVTEEEAKEETKNG
jgi:hypothetical protein